jgi:hypothetical protein
MSARDALVKAMAGNVDPNGNTVDIITQALELAAAEADAIWSLGDGGIDDTRGILAHALKGRLEALKKFVSCEGDFEGSAES